MNTEEINKKIEDIFKAKNQKQPTYQGPLPQGNNGLGLMLLGLTADQVLPQNIYQQIN